MAELARAVTTRQERFGGVERWVVSGYEVGRDGCWLHRWWVAQEITTRVVDAASIEVPRRQQRVKTDRIDGDKLLTLLQRAVDGEREVGSEVTVPRVEAEESRRLRQELARLKKERTGHRNRLQGFLAGQGVRLELKPDFLAQGSGRQDAHAASTVPHAPARRTRLEGSSRSLSRNALPPGLTASQEAAEARRFRRTAVGESDAFHRMRSPP